MPPILERLEPQQITPAVIDSIPRRDLFKELGGNNFAGLRKIAESGNPELLKSALEKLEAHDPLRRRLNRLPLPRQIFKYRMPDALRRAASASKGRLDIIDFILEGVSPRLIEQIMQI